MPTDASSYSGSSSSYSVKWANRYSFRSQLRVLLWKDFYIVAFKRNWLSLLFEVMLPLLATGFMIFIRLEFADSLSRESQPQVIYPAQAPPSALYFTNNTVTILYTPVTKYTMAIMSELERFRALTFGFDSLHDLELTSRRTNWTYTLIFTSSKAVPSHLGYIIRYDEEQFEVNTDLRYPNPPISEPLESFEYPTAIINHVFNAHMKYFKLRSDINLLLRRFPYPQHLRCQSLNAAALQYIIIYGNIIFVLRFVQQIVDEKRSRMRNYLQMNGITEWVYWASLFVNGFFVMFINSIICVFFNTWPIGDSSVPMVNYTSPALLMLILLLYSICAVLSLIFLSIFFNSAFSGIIIIPWILTCHLSPDIFKNVNPDHHHAGLLSRLRYAFLFPNSALSMCLQICTLREATCKRLTWANRYDPFLDNDNLSLGSLINTMFASIFLYMLLIYYFDNIWPWQYGEHKPLLFFTKKSYWRPDKDDKVIEPDVKTRQSPLFEPLQDDDVPVVALSHVTKRFLAKNVVDDVSLIFPLNKISAIIGPNGAGKSTIINMITGLLYPSSGRLSVNGHNIVTNTRLARECIGLCPQYNILFDSLTVFEHLVFFAMLKGCSMAESRLEAENILHRLQMLSKKNILSESLSASYKRKLSIANAVVGGNSILILDEPTSGIYSAKRNIWSILTELRKDKTIILTTHHMDEADYLADRITFLAHGKAVCSGSPQFLKKKFETGHKLKIITSSTGSNVEGVLSLAKSHVGSAAFVETFYRNAFSVNLGFPTLAQMVTLFKEIESKKKQLCVASLALSVTTMHDVYLKVGKLADKDTPDTMKRPHTLSLIKKGYSIHYERLQGMRLYKSQFAALWMKNLVLYRRSWWHLLYFIILPLWLTTMFFHPPPAEKDPLTSRLIFVTEVTLRVLKSNVMSSFKFISYNLSQLFGPSEGFIVTRWDSSLSTKVSSVLADDEVNVHYLPKNIVTTQYLLSRAKDFSTFIRRWKVGFELSGNELITWYMGEAYHTQPIALLLAQKLILSLHVHMTPSINVSINAQYSRGALHDTLTKLKRHEVINPRVRLILFGSFVAVIMTSSYIVSRIEQRISRSHHLQLTSGVPPFLYYLVHFLFDFTLHAICSFLITCAIIVTDQKGVFSSHYDSRAAVFVLFLLFGASRIPMIYLLSFIIQSPSKGFSMQFMFGFTTGIIWMLSMDKSTDYFYMIDDTFHSHYIHKLFSLFPTFSLIRGLANVHLNGALESLCPKIAYQCEDNYREVISDLCCQGCDPDYCYIRPSAFSDHFFLGISAQISSMFLTGTFAFIILILIEQNYLHFIIRYLQSKALDVQTPSDDDVKAEMKLVEECVQSGNLKDSVLVVDRMSKLIWSNHSINNISFRLKSKDCFGILGSSGTDESAILDLLSGIVPFTHGSAYIHQLDVNKDHSKYQSYIGYCCRTDPLLETLTGRECLRLIAKLRGVPEDDVERIVSRIIAFTKLEDCVDQQTKIYSGGNRRKLSLGLAALGTPDVLLLDQPTVGVDPQSCKLIWSMLIDVQENGSVMVLVSDSMEEYETLCNRMAILVNGSFACLGSSQYLKEKFGQGYKVIIKLARDTAANQLTTADKVTQDVDNLFPGMVKLINFQKATLHLRITTKDYSWGEMCEKFYNLSNIYNFENVIVADTSLEDVFTSFSQQQRKENFQHLEGSSSMAFSMSSSRGCSRQIPTLR